MPDLGTIPVWVWVLAGGVVLVAVAAFFLVRALWIRETKRRLVRVVSRREEVLAARRALEEVVVHLLKLDDEEFEHFAKHPESVDRKALTEVVRRTDIVAEELDTMALPRSLWPAAEALADAAYVVSEEAGRVGEDSEPDEVFEALAAIDLARLTDVFEIADSQVAEACERYELDEAAVYGGGLYI